MMKSRVEGAGQLPVYLAATLGCAFLLAACGGNSPEVIIYTSQDEVYAEPIFNDFTKETGIRVRAVYDSEAVKTVGLVNRRFRKRTIRNATCSGTTRNSACASC